MLRPRLAAGLVVVLLCAGTAGAGLPTISHEGRAYVELARVAETLKTTLEATAESTQARLRTSAHVVTFTRNWSRILIDGSPVVLDAPVVVRKGTWLVPETFLAQVMPKLVATVPAPPPAPTVILPAPATLEAVNRNAVQHLYMVRAFEQPGAVCERCGALQPPAPGRCQFCGAATRTAELGEAMVGRVLASGGEVSMIERHGGLADRDGVGAILRYAA